MRHPPKSIRRLFWEANPASIDIEHHADSILARVLEFGRLVDVRWLIATYGMERIHRFFRDVGHPEITDRTVHFWRAVFRAEDEPWARPPAWRRTSDGLWNN